MPSDSFEALEIPKNEQAPDRQGSLKLAELAVFQSSLKQRCFLDLHATKAYLSTNISKLWTICTASSPTAASDTLGDAQCYCHDRWYRHRQKGSEFMARYQV